MMMKNESAVSPVVGVMLMLVVTIIIAAIVSAFAGGAVGGTSKAPQATIQEYSQSKGMTITHSGGDAIPLGTTTVYVRPTKSFGASADKYSWQINKTVIYSNQTQTWANSRVFLPGDTASISQANLTYVQQRPDGTLGDFTDPTIGFDNPNSIGLSFVMEFQDASGKTIGQGTVTITG